MLLSGLSRAHTGWREILQRAQKAGTAGIQQAARIINKAGV